MHLRCVEGARCPNSWPAVEVKATGGDPVEVSHFAFDNTCWQWEVNGWARPGFASNPQTFALKHYTPGFLMVSRYGKVGIFFYNENDGQLGVLPVETAAPPVPPEQQPVSQPSVTPPEQKHAAVFRIGQNYYEAGSQTFPMDVAPYVKNGRTYLSIRYLANALGVRDQDITWNPNTQKVTLRKGDITLYLMVGSAEMMRTDAATSAKNFIPMDVAPEIVNGRLCLPARYVAEGFGYQAAWEEDTQAVLIIGAAPQGGTARGTTTSSNKAPGEALITFHPHTPVNLIEGTAGFQEGFAGGQQFWLLPVDTAVWGYRVYIQGEPYDTSPTSAWKKAPGETGVYYQDYPAQYKRQWSSNVYQQRDPQELTLSGLVAGARYQVWVVPLCVTKKADNWNVDKYGKVFRYGFITSGSPEVSGVVFIWAYKDSNKWGVVDKACLTWGEAEREKGYYVSGPAVIDSLDYYYVTAVRSGGGGGSSHGWMQ
ncbi:copper amine oxidase N-terminal domain-containing protein [Desulfofundulus sp.]|uniref:copper amine oxidase N-terminal domain-containing protein n=1 Tax=Desulfofundulus sp. TaxID=2282750 RepID=UPI003C7782AE